MLTRVSHSVNKEDLDLFGNKIENDVLCKTLENYVISRDKVLSVENLIIPEIKFKTKNMKN